MELPNPGWVEQDPQAIWHTTLNSAHKALVETDLTAKDVTAIGITNQRETTLVWDRQTGECVYNAIVWQDSRTAERCNEIRLEHLGDQSLSALISEQTGLVIDPYFSGTKLSWILDNVPGVRQRAEAGELCFGTVDTYLIWRLTGGVEHKTDASNASRTLLFDINQQEWSQTLLDYFAIPHSLMPEVCDSADDFGTTDMDLFGAEIPICGVAGDQQAALIGQACFDAGQTKSTYGTGCFVMANTGSEKVSSDNGLLTTVAYRLQGEVTYALEGSIFVAGVGVKWLRDQLGLISDAAETETAFNNCHGDTGGVYFVPSFTGLGAPYWQAEAKGLLTGLTLDSNRDQVVTAMLQAMAYQTEELLRAMRDCGAPVAQLRVDGGMVVNDALCQFLADILELSVLRPSDVETTARGAAVLAGLGCGLYASMQAAADAWQLDRSFQPEMTAESRTALLQGYEVAVSQVLAAGNPHQ